MSFKTIFLTGGTGFLGSELMRAFSDAGYEICALERNELSSGKPKAVEFVRWACDSSRARAELGYTYRSLEHGLRETLVSMNIPIANCGMEIDESQEDCSLVRGWASTRVVLSVSTHNPKSAIRNERKDDCCRTRCK